MNTIQREGGPRHYLRQGCGIILDATFKNPSERIRVLAMAAECGAPALFIECRAGMQEVLRRLRERERIGDDVSDAAEDVYRRHTAEFAPMTGMPERSHVAIDTTDNAEAIARRVEAARKLLLSPRPPSAAI